MLILFLKKLNKRATRTRTGEWYEFRRNLLTASNLWKAIDSESMRNSLILEKCKPINKKKTNSVNINSPFHQGHKYEPLSILMYEYMYNTKIGEFGCIRHDTIPFLGASPDGINIDRKNKRYGRLLEIKNPVSDRLLNGIPKKNIDTNAITNGSIVYQNVIFWKQDLKNIKMKKNLKKMVLLIKQMKINIKESFCNSLMEMNLFINILHLIFQKKILKNGQMNV